MNVSTHHKYYINNNGNISNAIAFYDKKKKKIKTYFTVLLSSMYSNCVSRSFWGLQGGANLRFGARTLCDTNMSGDNKISRTYFYTGREHRHRGNENNNAKLLLFVLIIQPSYKMLNALYIYKYKPVESTYILLLPTLYTRHIAVLNLKTGPTRKLTREEGAKLGIYFHIIITTTRLV